MRFDERQSLIYPLLERKRGGDQMFQIVSSFPLEEGASADADSAAAVAAVDTWDVRPQINPVDHHAPHLSLSSHLCSPSFFLSFAFSHVLRVTFHPQSSLSLSLSLCSLFSRPMFTHVVRRARTC